MTDRELMQMALDALEWCYDVTEWPANGNSAQDKAIEALRARLAQPEQEPVFVFRRKGLDDFCTCSEHRYNELAQKPNLFEVKKFYTAPPQREWQGLTDEEIEKIVDAYWNDPSMFVEAIEAKLKEKNS